MAPRGAAGRSTPSSWGTSRRRSWTYPSVKSARVVTDAVAGRPKGYGFVRFASEADRDKAMVQMNGQVVGSRAIRVSLATPKRSQGGMHHSGGPGGQSGYQSQQNYQPVGIGMASYAGIMGMGGLGLGMGQLGQLGMHGGGGADKDEIANLWPEFNAENVSGRECILEPGQALFVPECFFVHAQDLDAETVRLNLRVSRGRRLRSEAAVPLEVSRLLEERAAALASVREVHHWLSVVAHGEESDWIDTATVAGHRNQVRGRGLRRS